MSCRKLTKYPAFKKDAFASRNHFPYKDTCPIKYI